jgi:elongation factor P
MAKIGVNKLKVGAAFIEDGQPYKVLKYDFSKMGRGSANIKVKARNLETGSIVTKSYLSGHNVEELELTKRQLQYLYLDSDTLYFMDPASFEQIEIDRETVGDDARYLIEGETAWILFWPSYAKATEGQGHDKVLGVEIAASVVMRVKEAGSEEKGNSATNVLKRAEMDNGLVVSVPMFIKSGDKIKINTETGEYVARAN